MIVVSLSKAKKRFKVDKKRCKFQRNALELSNDMNSTLPGDWKCPQCQEVR